MSIQFVIRDQFISYSLSEFGQILGIPFEGQCSFMNEWTLDALSREQYPSGPYHTHLPSHEEIKMFNQTERTEHTPTTEQYNLAFFVAKLIEFVRSRYGFIFPYDVLLTRLFNHVMVEYPHLQSSQYVLVDRVMLSLGAPRQRKPRKDIGVKRTRHSNSSSSAFDHGSSSHQVNDDENRGDEGTSRVSTPSPTTYYKSSSQNIPPVFSNPLPHELTMENLFTRQTSMLN
ncbi:hypothetical protein Tco_0062752 [Tanacetum coccineum]